MQIARRIRQAADLLKDLRAGRTTPGRAFNRVLAWAGRRLTWGVAPGLPDEIYLEPTNLCNLRCPLCPCGASLMKREKGFVALETLDRLLDQVGASLTTLKLWHYGEPLLHRDIIAIMELAKARGIPHVMLSTNIILLRDRGLAERMVRSGLDHALLCLEGAAPETYAFYRRSGDFEDALSGLRNLVEAKRASGGKTPFLELQFIVMKHNEHEIAKITALAEEIGVDRLSFKNCDVDLTCDELKAVMLDFLPGERENIIRKLLESPETPLQGCSQMMRSCVVLWNGDVVPCCYDWEGRHVFGNMNSEAFRKIWNGPAYVRFRKQVARNRRAIAMCAVCPEGLGSLFYE